MNKSFLEKYDMLPKDCSVLCAVSGGKDSMYLLCRMLELSKERELSVSCAHFDHRLRGAESDGDREFVKSFCAERGVPCYVGSGDVSLYAKDNGLGTEEAARVLRYRFLEETAEQIGASRIATAHTADDNAETVLLNLARGTGLKGLCGIPPVRGKIIRPMLEVTTAEVLQYLEAHGIPHVEDSTNASCDYSRNRLRHRVIPELKAINGAFTENLARSAGCLREDEEFLSGLARSFLDESYKNCELSASALSALPRPVSARVLQSICSGCLSAEHIEAVRKIAAGEEPHAETDLPGMRVRRSYDRLIFGATESGHITPCVAVVGRQVPINGTKLSICTEFIEKCSNIHNSFNTFFFKSASICGNITVDSRREGESIRLAGRGCTKSLKKLFSEKRLNGAEKDLVPVLYDEEGAIAVYGMGAAERCLASNGDDVIKIEIISSDRQE